MDMVEFVARQIGAVRADGLKSWWAMHDDYKDTYAYSKAVKADVELDMRMAKTALNAIAELNLTGR